MWKLEKNRQVWQNLSDWKLLNFESLFKNSKFSFLIKIIKKCQIFDCVFSDNNFSPNIRESRFRKNWVLENFEVKTET